MPQLTFALSPAISEDNIQTRELTVRIDGVQSGVVTISGDNIHVSGFYAPTMGMVEAFLVDINASGMRSPERGFCVMCPSGDKPRTPGEFGVLFS